MRDSGVVEIISDAYAGVVDAPEVGSLGRIGVGVIVETESVATLAVCLTPCAVIVFHIADDLAGIIDPAGSADARERCVGETRRIERAKAMGIGEHTVPDVVLVSLYTDNLPVVVDAGQKSRSRAREIDGGEAVSGRRPGGLRSFRAKDLAVELLDHAKAAKLSLHPIPVAVMIAVFGGEPALGKLIDGFDFGDNLDRERQWRLPAGLQVLLIFEIKGSGRCISHTGDGPDMIIHLVQEIRLVSASKVEKEHVPA